MNIFLKKIFFSFSIFLLIFSATPTINSEGLPETFRDLADELLPGVVNISTTQIIKDRYNNRPEFQFPPGSPFEDMFRDFFDMDRWQIGQPIIMSDIAYELSLVDGVSSVVPPKDNNPSTLPILITNKYKVEDGYSGNFYDIESALIEGIVYPALDPSIFEIKYPNSDIEGKVLGDNLGAGD